MSELLLIPEPNYTYNAAVTKVIDGDTIDLMISVGFNTYVHARIHVKDADAYELRSGTEDEKALGAAAKDMVSAFLPVGTDVRIKSYKTPRLGRWDADVYFFNSKDGTWISIGQRLHINGYVKPNA